MYGNQSLRRISLLSKFFLGCIPAKKRTVAITLHNLLPSERVWFLEVVEHISEKYGFIDPSDSNYLLESSVGSQRVMLTFDDGFSSSALAAYEVLEKRKIKAIFFITEEFVGLKGVAANAFVKSAYRKIDTDSTNNGFMYDAMSWDDIGRLQSMGHKIGAHTATHPYLSNLSQDGKKVEIIDSADRLERRLGEPIRLFAYPFGSYDSIDQVSVNICRARFDLSFSNIRGSILESPSPQFVFRQNLVPGTPLWLVDAIIEGRLDWWHAKIRRQALLQFAK